MEHNETRLHRLVLLGGFLFLFLAAYLLLLFQTQVSRHEEYLAQSIHSIAKEERVDASRGIITDRNGRTLISNSSAYFLTFDAGALKAGEDQNQAILRLLELCESQEIEWADNLPVSPQAPFFFTIDQSTNTQKARFLTYLRSIKETRLLLGGYLLEHPELIPAEEEETEPGIPIYVDGVLLETEKEEETAPALTQSQQMEYLLSHFPASALTAQLLADAGISAEALMQQMTESMDIPASFSLWQQRQVLGVRYELALRKLGSYSDYVMAENLDISFISLINDGHYAGAKVTTSSTRRYETTAAAHILGYVSRLDASDDLAALRAQGYDGNDWIGRSGAEAAFESYLKGTDGRRILSINNEGKITGQYYATTPQPGHTVELTIDLDFQQSVEDALAQVVESMNEKDGLVERGAGAAVIQVGTGEVLALASYPTYNLSTFRQHWSELSAIPANPMFNRATQGAYAPGSTLKPLTAVAALEEGEISLTEKIRDTGRWVYPNDPTNSGAYCWRRSGHGLVNVVQAITVSCNYFFAEMGYRLGMDTFTEYLTAFGLGESTGIETGDRTGTLPSNNAGENQTPWAAFGQSNQLYTPIQLANYIATLVSGGNHCQAHLLKTVKTYDNSEIVAEGNTTPINTVNIRESTLNAVKQGMLGYTQPGGMVYSAFKDCIVSAGAKTGTAQLGEDVENNGVFVCFAPYDEPEIALAIVIEKGGSGASLASTAVTILNAYFAEDEIGTAIIGENQLIP